MLKEYIRNSVEEYIGNGTYLASAFLLFTAISTPSNIT